MNIVQREFLCIGHPRCGTGYISHLLTAFGWQVGHEDMKQDGISSWMLTVNSDNYPWGNIGNKFNRPIRQFEFNTIIHIIRNPFDAIPSIILENKYSPTSYIFMRNQILQELHIELPEHSNSRTLQEDIIIATQTFLYWNILCSMKSPSIVIQLEDSFELLQKYNKTQLTKDKTETLFRNSTKTKCFGDKKRYTKININLEEYKSIPLSLQIQLCKFCETYGYKSLLQVI